MARPCGWQTPENITFLRNSFLAGKNDQWIADQLGITKGQAIGKRHRMLGSRAEAGAMAHERPEKVRPTASDLHSGPAPEWRTEQADVVLREMWDRGVPNGALETFFGVSRNQLRARRITLRLTPRAICEQEFGCNGWGTAEGDAEFRRQWDEHVPAAEIRAHFGVSTTSMKTRRLMLGLTAREGGRGSVGTLAPLKSVVAPVSEPRFKHDPRSMFGLRISPMPVERPITVALPMTAKCQWPLWGDYERPTHKYCDAATEVGQSWCAGCRKRVFSRAAA